MEFRQKKIERRRKAAISIQSAYRRMLSYRALDRKRVIWQSERRRSAATRIQCLVRSWRSCMLTVKLRERLLQEKRTNAATRSVGRWGGWCDGLGGWVAGWLLYVQVMLMERAELMACADMYGGGRLQAVFRGSLGRKKHRIVARLLQQQAAIMIQCAWRTKRARTRVRTVRATRCDELRQDTALCWSCRGVMKGLKR